MAANQVNTVIEKFVEPLYDECGRILRNSNNYYVFVVKPGK